MESLASGQNHYPQVSSTDQYYDNECSEKNTYFHEKGNI